MPLYETYTIVELGPHHTEPWVLGLLRTSQPWVVPFEKSFNMKLRAEVAFITLLTIQK